MAKLKSVEEIKAYYDFCTNMEIIAMHNVVGHVPEEGYQKAINDACKYMDMNPVDFTYEAQPNTEEGLNWWFGENHAIYWVLEDIIKEERENDV